MPEIGKQIADKATREGVAKRRNAPARHQTIAVDLALITDDDALLQDLELSSLQTATQHAAPSLSLRQTVPGSGTMLSRTLLYASPQSDRFPSGQDFASSARRVTCPKASAGKRLGTAGKQSGHAPLPWAFAAAAVWFLRTHHPGQTLLARLEKPQGQGKALSLLAPTLGRAVYDVRK